MKQNSGYISNVLSSKNRFRVALEARVGQGWYQLLTENSHLVSVEDFGTSVPGEEVAKQLGFVAKEIAEDILDKLE